MKTNAGELSAEGRRALYVCSKQTTGATDVPQPQLQLDHSIPQELMRYSEPFLFIFLTKLCGLFKWRKGDSDVPLPQF